LHLHFQRNETGIGEELYGGGGGGGVRVAARRKIKFITGYLTPYISIKLGYLASKQKTVSNLISAFAQVRKNIWPS